MRRQTSLALNAQGGGRSPTHKPMCKIITFKARLKPGFYAVIYSLQIDLTMTTNKYQDLDIDTSSAHAIKQIHAYQVLIVTNAFPTADMVDAFNSYCEHAVIASLHNSTVVVAQQKIVAEYLQYVDHTYFSKYPPSVTK